MLLRPLLLALLLLPVPTATAHHVAEGIPAAEAHTPWFCRVRPHEGLYCRDALERLVLDPDLLHPQGCGASPLLNEYENSLRIQLCRNALSSHSADVEQARFGGRYLPAANETR